MLNGSHLTKITNANAYGMDSKTQLILSVVVEENTMASAMTELNKKIGVEVQEVIKGYPRGMVDGISHSVAFSSASQKFHASAFVTVVR